MTPADPPPAPGKETRPDTEREIARLERLAGLLDDRFRIPGTNIRFGLDPVLGLLPGVGDLVMVAVGAYMIGKADSLGVPRTVQVRMGLNLLLDFLVGSVPLLGDVFDLLFRANRRNIDLVRRHARF